MESDEKYTMRKTKAGSLVTLIVIGLIISTIPMFVSTSSVAADSNWALISDGRGVKAYLDLREYVWHKNASMSPNGQYDKIGLHRLVKTGATPKGVVFILAGIYGNGEQLVSNPPESNYNAIENFSQPIYWANRGFDVYAMDFRTHFIPITFNASQLSFMADWGFDQYISDIKEAVDKAKELSGAKKIFIAGESLGGQFAMYYASKYWQQDLRGIILLDSTDNTIQAPNATNSYNLTAAINYIKAARSWSIENPYKGTPVPSGMIFVYQYAYQNPGAPAQYPNGTLLQPTINPLTNSTWANITEWIAYSLNTDKTSNIYGGYGDITANIPYMAAGDRYYPVRLSIEATAIKNWTNCPYVTYDFDDHFKEINVPLLGFRSELLGIPTYGNYTNGMATSDFTQIVLPKYGHRDVWLGTYSARDVSEPVYQWMVSHYQPMAVSATPTTTSVTAGQSATFAVSASGGTAPLTYQWYEGTSLLAGKTFAQLTTTKDALSYSTYYCQVTDAEGTTLKSNLVTLLAYSQTQPTPVPSPTPTPTPTPTPSPSPSPSPSPPTSPSPTPTNPEFALPPKATIAIAAAIIIIVIAAIAIVLRKKAK